MSDLLPLAGFFAACFLTSLSGAIFKPGPWYDALKKPWWRPPNWLFPPAWGILFIMIAISGWLVWREAGFGFALVVYTIQLVINFGWSGLFFGLRRLDLALYELMALWLSILACIIVFAPISTTAAWLMVPYLAWVSFAGYLNFTMLKLNGPKPA